MSSVKHSRAGLLTVKAESQYLTDPTPAVTDAVRFIEPPTLAIRYGFDGARGVSNGSFGDIEPVAPNGRNVTLGVKCHGKGRGAAYTSAAVEVPDVHRLLRACGFDATVTTTGGSEKWDFTPTSVTATPGSVTAWAYTYGELLKINGLYGNVRIVGDSTGIPVWDFALAGVAPISVPFTDLSQPVATYTAPTVIPPSAVGISLTLGSFTAATVRTWEFDLGRTFDQSRVNQNAASGHAGFQPGPRQPVFKCRIEGTTLQSTPYHAAGAIDPYQLVAQGTSGLAFSMTISLAQYNRWKLLFGQCKVIGVERVEDADAFCWDLTLKPYVTGDQDNSDITIRFD